MFFIKNCKIITANNFLLKMNNIKAKNFIFDCKLFETDQKYHDKFKNYQTPYNTDYYDIYLKKYLENNVPTELILINYFTKLYSWNYNISQALNLAKYFIDLHISKDLLKKIFLNIYGPIDWKTNELSLGFDNFNLMIIFVNVLEKILNKSMCNIDVESLYSNMKNIKINYFISTYQIKKSDKEKLRLLIEPIKKLYNNLYKLNKDEEIQIETLEYLIEHNLLDEYIPKNIIEYRLMYKYETSIRKLKSFKNFKPDIYCLENACKIALNTNIIASLIKTIEPNSVCLSNALKHKNNHKVIKILVDKVEPTIEQIKIYGYKLHDLTLNILIETIN